MITGESFGGEGGWVKQDIPDFNTMVNNGSFSLVTSSQWYFQRVSSVNYHLLLFGIKINQWN